MATPQARFHPLTRILHWAIALHMIGLIALGWWMIDLSFYSAWYYTAPNLHKAFGVLVFVLGVVLLVWRIFAPKPTPLENHRTYEKVASKIAHWLLFASVLTIPVSGYIFSIANGEGISIFELFEIPALFAVSNGVRDAAIDFHIYASYGLLAVIAAHAAGALKHHFVDRDATLRRMTV